MNMINLNHIKPKYLFQVVKLTLVLHAKYIFNILKYETSNLYETHNRGNYEYYDENYHCF